ncbi:MAG: prolipoprotein diacylglyceryl transferase [Phycisphaeraceae bacterium]
MTGGTALIPTLAAWLHDLDPVAFTIPGIGFGVRWYGLSYLVGFILGFLLIRRVATAGKSPLDATRAADFVVAVAIGIVVGGRLGYVLFYSRELLVDFSGSFPFWGVLAINEGGMASHGGMIGALLGSAVFAWRHKLPVFHLADLVAFAAPAGLALGRVANFINGELIGRPVRDSFPLAVKFPQELYRASSAKWNEIAAALPPVGEVFQTADAWSRGLVVYAVQQDLAPVKQAVEPLLTPRHPSQLYAAALEGVFVLLVLAIVYARPRKPGLVAFTFGVTYAIMRILDETWRLPDAQFIEAGQLPAVTQGQWLSIVLLLVTAMGLIWRIKKPAEPLGGWMRSSPDTTATSNENVTPPSRS